LLGFSKRNKFTESQLRSVTKVVTWRVMVTLTNFLGGLISTVKGSKPCMNLLKVIKQRYPAGMLAPKL